MLRLLPPLAVLILANASFASDCAVESVGLASEPLPAPTRNRFLTASEVAAFTQVLRNETVSDVLQTLGQPDEVVFATTGDIQLSYQFGRPLVVTIRDGRVSTVGHRVIINAEEQERQTGVRDDDFVGLVGP
jgi:hypothetical protein